MDAQQLSATLKPFGFIVHADPNYWALQGLTNCRGRWIISVPELYHDGALMPGGPSFWVSEGDVLAYFGTFNGELFQLGQSESIADICRHICQQCAINKRPDFDTHFALMGDYEYVIERFQLKRTQLVYFAQSTADFWDEAVEEGLGLIGITTHELDNMLASLSGVRYVREESTSIFRISFGTSLAFTRVVNASACDLVLTFAFQPSLRDNEDDVGLLHKLLKLFRLAAFDGCWANRIEQSDPYYQWDVSSLRPQTPRLFADT